MAQAVLVDMKNIYPMLDSTSGSSGHGTTRALWGWQGGAGGWDNLLNFAGLAVGHTDGNITVFDIKTATVWQVR